MSDVPDRYRYERKFTVVDVSLPELVHCVRHHPEMFFTEFPARYINNIYLDSPALHCYRQNIDGHSQRAKFRARWYGPLFGPLRAPTLEKKCKSGYLGTKLSARLAPFEFEPRTTTRQVEEWLARSDIPEDLRRELRHAHPVLVNRYRRLYFRSASRRLRLTVDSELAFYRFRHTTNSFLSRAHPSSLLVVELKYSDDASDEAAQAARLFPFRLTRMSKYVFGLNAVGSV